MKHRLFVAFVAIVCSVSALAEPIKVACVGNSVTYGMCLENREQTCYPAQLQLLLGDGYDVRNFGKSGATLLNKGHRPYTKEPEFSQAVQFAADRVVIHLGLNDTDPRNWPNYRDEFLTDYLALIDTFRAVNPKCEIWICRMTPITCHHRRFRSSTRDWYEQIQAAIEHVAQVADVKLIDLQAPLYARVDLFPDALHPNAEGAKIIANTVYSHLTGDFGGLQLPAVFSDNMVLQREKPICISGIANAGERVDVRFAGQHKNAIAAADGRWSVELKPMKAGRGYELKVSTKNKTLNYKNVAVGEVWVCSGQSNMAFMMHECLDSKADIANANNGDIRLYDMKPRELTNEFCWDTLTLRHVNEMNYYLPAAWTVENPTSVNDFSAVAYYFGRMLADSLQVPVGLICNAVGGAPLEAFIDKKTVEFNHQLVNILYDWTKNDMVQDWVRGRAIKNIEYSKNPLQHHPYEPTYLFDAGIRPLTSLPIRGAIWYQGESNAHNVELFESMFPVMVQSWRKAWGDDFPFLYVQLSSMERPSWAHFRDAQRHLLRSLDDLGMAVSSDVGHRTDVHPKQKRPVGERLAAWALHNYYGLSHVVPSGPLVKDVVFEKSSALVSFDYAEGLSASDGAPLRGFEIAGDDGIFHAAQAAVKGKCVRVKNKKVKNPVAVRYAWQPYTDANLVNGAKMPASTFKKEKTTDLK